MSRFIAVVFTLLFAIGCGASVEVNPWKIDSKGIRYQIFSEKRDTLSPKIGDDIAFDLQIFFRDDSLIYDSKKRGHSLEFIFSDKMFSGSFSEVVPQLSVGDSCVLEMESQQFYPGGMPRGLEKGDSILCVMRLTKLEPR